MNFLVNLIADNRFNFLMVAITGGAYLVIKHVNKRRGGK